MCRNNLSLLKTGARKSTNWIIRLAPTPHPLREQTWTSAALPTAQAEVPCGPGSPGGMRPRWALGQKGSPDRSEAAACYQVSIGQPAGLPPVE